MRKIAMMPRRAGRRIVEPAIILYVILTDRETPVWARALIIAVLGYFIWPLDAIPDAIPFLGYTDDAILLTAAIARLTHMITPAVRERVRRLMPNKLN